MKKLIGISALSVLVTIASQFGLATEAEAYCVINSRDSDSSLYFYSPDHQGDFEKKVAPGKKECCKSGSSGCSSYALKHKGALMNVSPDEPKYRAETAKAAKKRDESRIFRMKIGLKDILDCKTLDKAVFCSNGAQQWRSKREYVSTPGQQNDAVIQNVMIVGPNDKCLDVAGRGKKDGTPVHLWKCYGTKNQRWNIEKSGRIVSRDSGRCLDIWASGKLTIYGCGRRAQHYWDFEGRSFVSKRNEKCLVSTKKKPGNGTKVSVAKCDKKDAAQQWFIADEM